MGRGVETVLMDIDDFDDVVDRPAEVEMKSDLKGCVLMGVFLLLFTAICCFSGAYAWTHGGH